ncbi:EF-hand domain-containing protein [Parapontixanthobacter aurantiacus]
MRFTIVAVMFALAAPLSAQQAGEDGSLTRSDFISQMDAEFSRLDGDANGFINEGEILASQRQSAREEALRQNARVFAGLDADKDGQLSQQEFAALANPDAIPVDAAPLMQQFDSDRDGVITLVEYRIGTQANFDKIDSDRDGVVSDMEMRAAGIVR